MLWAGTIFLLFLLDRLTKLILLFNPSWTVDGFLALRLNPQLAFSWPMVAGAYYPLVLIILFCLFYYAKRSYRRGNVSLWPLSLIIIGAVSNLVDRVFYGAVIDFFHWPNWFAFNLADVYITWGVMWLIFFRKSGDKIDKAQ